MTRQVQKGFVAPEPDPDSSWWWEALAARRLMLQRCGSCRRPTFPPTPSCPHCGSDDLVPLEACGHGQVYSWVTVHRALDPRFSEDTPYTILAVSLDEGPRLFGRLLGEDAGLAAGARVTAAFYDLQGTTLVGFVLDV